MRIRTVLLLAALASAPTACHLGGLRAEPVAVSIQRPSNVAFYVRISDAGEPQTTLKRENFEIYENGQRLNSDQIGLTFLNRDSVVAHATLLLVDVSGADEATTKALGAAGASFAKHVQKTQPVIVYAFDGTDKIRKIAEFETGDAAQDEKNAEALAELPGGDRSRDLNGAIVSGLAELDAELAQMEKPVRVGSLVVVTRGADLAGRVPPAQLDAVLSRTNHQIYAVGIGQEGRWLERIGRTRTFRADTIEAAADQALADAANRVNAAYGSHYLLAYCSPARAGRPQVRVQVGVTDDKGKQRIHSFTSRFDASGFESGCDPKTPPRFVSTLVFEDGEAIATAAPAASAEPENPPAEDKEEPAAEPAPEPKPKPARPAARRPAAKRPAPKPAAAPPPPAPPPPPPPKPEPAPPAPEFEP
jgi:hypothetical protein